MHLRHRGDTERPSFVLSSSHLKCSFESENDFSPMSQLLIVNRHGWRTVSNPNLTPWRESWCNPLGPRSSCSRSRAPGCRDSCQNCVPARVPKSQLHPAGSRNDPVVGNKRERVNLLYSNLRQPLLTQTHWGFQTLVKKIPKQFWCDSLIHLRFPFCLL